MGELFISQTTQVSLIMFRTSHFISITIIRDLEEVKIAEKFFFWLVKANIDLYDTLCELF